MNLCFTPGYKGDFNVNLLNAVDSGDFTNNDVDGFVGKLFALDKFKCCYGTFDFAKPTDISPIFGLEGDVSGYLFTEEDFNPSVAVDGFGINIRITIYNNATRDTQIGSVWSSNCIVQGLGAISPCDRQCKFTRGEGACDSRSFACDLDSASTYYDLTGSVVEGNCNSPIYGNLSAQRGCTYEVSWDRFIRDHVIVSAAASER